MLNIILFGAPGAGKGTQSRELVKKYNLAYISTGDILRKEMAEGTELGVQAKDIINRGELVSDELIIEIIEHAIEQAKGKGILFDGFPRTVKQAESLEKLLKHNNRELSAVLSLDVPREELIGRMLKRAAIEGRADDNEEVIQNRFKEYEAKTRPVADFYQKEGTFHPVVGMGTVEEVFERLSKEIDKLNK